MKIIVTTIPTDLVTNRFYPLFALPYKQKTIMFSASRLSGNKKYFCFLFTASHALLQSHAEFNRLLKRNFLTCNSYCYFSSMLWWSIATKLRIYYWDTHFLIYQNFPFICLHSLITDFLRVTADSGDSFLDSFLASKMLSKLL